MKLQEELRSVKGVFPYLKDLLEAAAQRIEDQRLWREAWLNAEKRVELLTSELAVINSRLNNRKEKESDD
jgi:hypothetical protein